MTSETRVATAPRSDHDAVVARVPPDFRNRMSADDLALITPRTLVERITELGPFGSAHAAAQGVVARCRQQLAGRVSLGVKQSERPAVQMALGRADVEVRLAELALRDAVTQLTELAERGSADAGARARIRAQVTTASTLCRTATRDVVDALGTTVHETANPIQRAVRDITVGAGHVIHDRSAALELHGRLLLGMDPSPTLF